MMRHPVEREISLFYYLGKAEWEDGYREDFGNMTLLEYATFANNGDHDNANDSGGGGRNNHVRLDNWMVRYLAFGEETQGRNTTKRCAVGQGYSEIQESDWTHGGL